MISLAALEQIVPAPKHPVGAHGDWAAIERDLGTPLPHDWKALIEAYGYGSFCDFFHLLSPFFEPCTMQSQARATLEANRQLAKIAPNAVPFAQFPDADGALPWARTDNGDVAYWLMMGDVNEWPVAIWNPRGGSKFDLIDGGAVHFLERWLGGQLRCSVFPRDLDFTADKREARVWFDAWMLRAGETISVIAQGEAPHADDETNYAWRLRALLEAMQPVTVRGSYGDDDDEKRQVHFVAEDGAWRLTYDTVYGHTIRLSAPPEQMDLARERVARAIVLMACRMGQVTKSG